MNYPLTSFIKKLCISLWWFLFFLFCGVGLGYAQTAPTHLKYFGFSFVDCGLDDPNDTMVKTNYVDEVDSFSNVLHLCVSNYTDTIVSRVNTSYLSCMKPFISIQDIFYFVADANAPSGSNYNLYPDFIARWDTFKSINATVDISKIEAFYVFDEPFWNGVTFQELDTVCSLIKMGLPTIPLFIVEAYPVVNSMEVPTTIDWIAFDEYGVFDVSADISYLNKLAIVKSKRSTPNQKLFLIFDDQFAPWYNPSLGWQPDTMVQVVQNYYNLAASDTDIIGLAGFTWPGIASDWLGARSLPQTVIDKTVEIGQMIKANYSPCITTDINKVLQEKEYLTIYPNPNFGKFKLVFENTSHQNTNIEIVDVLGERVMKTNLPPNQITIDVDISKYPTGIYLLTINDGFKNYSQKFILQ